MILGFCHKLVEAVLGVAQGKEGTGTAGGGVRAGVLAALPSCSQPPPALLAGARDGSSSPNRTPQARWPLASSGGSLLFVSLSWR